MSPQFNYRARTSDGSAVEGTVEADNRDEVARSLRNQDMFITSLEKADERSSILSMDMDLEKLKFWDAGFNTAELAHFSKQFSVLVEAGVPLVQSLEIMEEQAPQKKTQEMLQELRSTVEAGSSFSEALSDHPEFFPPLFVHLVKAGETGGVLDEVLDELAEYYKRRDEINKKVKSALYYPAVIVVVAVVAVLILLTFVLPTITDMLLQVGGELPLPTVVLISISDFFNQYWWAVFGLLALVAFGFKYYINTESGKDRKDRLILRLPVIGDLVRKIIISRFANTLALLLQSGVNIINGLPVLENVVNNELYREVLQEARARVREGTNLSRPLEQSGEFPPIVIQMIQVGEETGNMEEMLERLSEYYDVEVENAIEGGISLIEPAMIIIMAFVVGSIIMSIILPLFDIYQQI